MLLVSLPAVLLSTRAKRQVRGLTPNKSPLSYSYGHFRTKARGTASHWLWMVPQADGFRACTVRTRMQQFVQRHPNAQCVRVLPQAERVGFDQDRAWITDSQARLVAVACAMDIFIFDLPNQSIRSICHGEGAVRYPSRQVIINMLRTRIGDQQNPSCMLRYSAGHYEALVKH